MTADTRQSNGGRGGDDWLGAGELDWGEAPAGSRPPVRSSAPGEPLWPDHDRPEHADEATIRRRRMIGLIVLVAAVGFVIVVAVLAFGGGSSDDNAAVTLPTTTAQQPATTPTTTPKTSTTPKTTTTPQTPSTGTLTLAEGQTLRTGDSGEQVKQLQQALTTLGYKPGAVDGDFGATTANAVGEFQRANDLADDGVVGPATAQAINAAVANQSSAGAGTGTTAAAGA